MTRGASKVGQILDGRYRIERLLGEGGMGSVYEGHHVLLGKRVAIKMLHPEYATSEEVLKRFYREAQSAAAIGHKNIIEIFDVGVTQDNAPYIAMEYLEGEDLESLLEREKKLSVEAAYGVLEPALLALEAAHAKGIVHRDLKPANIFVACADSGVPTVKLIDFGISKVTGTGGTKLTQTGSLLGTPAYMSPEQARGVQEVDHRSDIYAMGVILYQMITGELPFQGAHYNELLINVLTTAPRPLRELEPSVPADAEAVVLRQLSKDPAERCQSAQELLENLQGLAGFAQRDSGMSLLATRLSSQVASGDIGVSKTQGSPSSASKVLEQLVRNTPGGWSRTTAQSQRRQAWMPIGVAAAAVVVAVGLVFFLRGTGPEPDSVIVPASGPVVPVAADEGVLLEVTGLPAEAEILFNGVPVSTNPFRVPRAMTNQPLVVKLVGHEPFVTSVVPDDDKQIEVALQPLSLVAPVLEAPVEGGAGKEPAETKRDSRRKSKSSASVKAPPGAAESNAPRSQGGKLSKGRRGTQFSESFE